MLLRMLIRAVLPLAGHAVRARGHARLGTTLTRYRQCVRMLPRHCPCPTSKNLSISLSLSIILSHLLLFKRITKRGTESESLERETRERARERESGERERRARHSKRTYLRLNAYTLRGRGAVRAGERQRREGEHQETVLRERGEREKELEA